MSALNNQVYLILSLGLCLVLLLNKTHVLKSLLMLEMLGLLVFTWYTLTPATSLSPIFSLFILFVFFVCEACLGLSVLIKQSRLTGSDSLNV